MISGEVRQEIVDKRLDGLTFKQIGEVLGVAYETARRVCFDAGVNGKPWKENRDEQMRAYKAEGRTNKEVAEVFGVSEGTAASACRGIASQGAEGWKKLTVENNIEKYEEYARECVEKNAPGFEYFGGYAGSEKPCQIRCKTCGSVMTRGFGSVRHGKIACPVCKECEKLERQKAARKEAEEKKIKKEREREEREKRKVEAAEEKRKAKEARMHPCVICGTPTANKFCCSEACAKKRNNHDRDAKRRAKVRGAMVDNDITLQRVFFNDGGVCYLCGETCDWSDKETREDGTIVCGNTYPSIDHVIPLAKGGKHAWNNVRLAHRLCNTCKSDKIIPPPSIF